MARIDDESPAARREPNRVVIEREATMMDRPTRLQHARTIALPTFVDDRGVLTAAEGGQDIPFEVRRIFYVYGIKPPFERGGHAHPRTEQLLVAIAGRLKVDLSDGVEWRTVELDDPARGLYIPALIWARLYDFSAGAVCLAAASTHYDNATVIRDWNAYLRAGRGEWAR